MPQRPESVPHPTFTRRTALQAGSIGLLGLGMAEVTALRGLAAETAARSQKSVIFIFLTGGLSHQDSFDLKPDAPAEVRGEFRPIATRTPGLQVCEHLPLLAQRSERFALVRSMGTSDNGHGIACHMLLTGRLDFPAAFNPNKAPNATEWPSMASLVTSLMQGRNHLPPAVVLPQPSINEAGEVRLGQFAGRLGQRWEAWHVQIAAKCALGNGACPYCFRFDGTPFKHVAPSIFETPMLRLPEGGRLRLDDRAGLLGHIERQQHALEQTAEGERL